MDKTKEYCDVSENCKLLKSMAAKYEEVVKQNKNLQSELNYYKGLNGEKDNK